MNIPYARMAAVVAAAAITSLATAALAQATPHPYKHGPTHVDPVRPLGHVGPYEPPYVAPRDSASGIWTNVGNLPFSNGPWNSILLTDGTVMVLDVCSKPGQWYRLTPDSKGRYETGTWSKPPALPSNYSPLYFASQVLPDGRLIMNGGEYNAYSFDPCNDHVETTQGALYDPVANTWASVAPPSGWNTIGDAESVILPNGTYMLADCCDIPAVEAMASVNGTNWTWSTVNGFTCPQNDQCNGEEAFTPLPDGRLLVVDAWNIGSNYDDWETYDPATNNWELQGTTPDLLADADHELGPAAWMPNGFIIQFGATQRNDLLDPSTSTWVSAPIFPTGYDCADAPAATLPDGHVLVEASPGDYNTPSHFFEYYITSLGTQKLVQVNDPAQAPYNSSYQSTMLVLPTGQVLWGADEHAHTQLATYTPVGKPQAAWLPIISAVSSVLSRGGKGYTVSGKNFNGFDLGGVYGDDAQSSTNFPLVRLTNRTTGDVCYARSYNFSTMGVWTSGTTYASFDVPSSCESGKSKLQVIVNGIASQGVSVKVF